MKCYIKIDNKLIHILRTHNFLNENSYITGITLIWYVKITSDKYWSCNSGKCALRLHRTNTEALGLVVETVNRNGSLNNIVIFSFC
jgi:hypothetical protein